MSMIASATRVLFVTLKLQYTWASHLAFDSLLPERCIEEGFSRSGYTIGHNSTISIHKQITKSLSFHRPATDLRR